MTTAAPHGGGSLVNREVDAASRAEALGQCREMPALYVDPRAASDVELLATGALTPLEGFMHQRDYRAVLERMRLEDGALWTLPITLTVSRQDAGRLKEGRPVALVAEGGRPIGVLHLDERYAWDPREEAQLVYGTEDPAHPGVAYLLGRGPVALGGRVDLIERPALPGFERYRLSPRETRARFHEVGWRTVVGFQTRNPIHRSHEYIQKCALELVDGLLIHPLVGETKSDDTPADVRLGCYEALVEHYFPRERVLLSVFPGAMRYAGPREAVFHALVRKNYGCTHFIVGRDAAGVGSYYASYAAHELLRSFSHGELGIEPLLFTETFYCRRCGTVASGRTCPHADGDRLVLSGSRVRELLRRGEALPGEFTRPEVSAVLTDWARGS